MKNFQSLERTNDTHQNGEQDPSGPVTAQRKEYAGRTNFPLAPVQKKSAKGGLPSGLKEGIEGLSGIPLEDVQVHYNSPKPSGLQALAYAQGSDIHLGPGQEKHLAHEAWHVVQQKQGRVKPTMQLKKGVLVNDEKALEQEADIMGGKALTQFAQPFSRTAPTGSAIPTTVVQRNEESGKLMIDLATPKVFPGPEIKIQDEIVKGLEEQLSKIDEKEQVNYNVTCVGGIELSEHTTGSLEELIKSAELVELKDHALGKSTFNLVHAAGLEKLIVINTLATMETAGQLEYLRKSGLIDKDWKIIVEVHYYRDRDPSQTKFHKDTRGETLFVNLNFVNEEPVAGPEFIINPASTEKYDQYVSEHLPPVFVEDLNKSKKEHGKPKQIGMSVIPKKGVVTFVDEAIHHKTPTLGHRTVSAGAIAMALKKKYGQDYEDAQKAYNSYSSRGFLAKLYSYSSYLTNPKSATAEEWYSLLHEIQNTMLRFDRVQLAKILPKPDFLDIDTLIEEGGAGDFGSATFLHAKTGKIPVKKEGKSPLKRQMSEKLLKGEAPKSVPGKRRFFRTWVRAVRRG